MSFFYQQALYYMISSQGYLTPVFHQKMWSDHKVGWHLVVSRNQCVSWWWTLEWTLEPAGPAFSPLLVWSWAKFPEPAFPHIYHLSCSLDAPGILASGPCCSRDEDFSLTWYPPMQLTLSQPSGTTLHPNVPYSLPWLFSSIVGMTLDIAWLPDSPHWRESPMRAKTVFHLDLATRTVPGKQEHDGWQMHVNNEWHPGMLWLITMFINLLAYSNQ